MRISPARFCGRRSPLWWNILPNLAPTSFVPALIQPLVSRETTSATASVQTTGKVAPEGIAAQASSKWRLSNKEG